MKTTKETPARGAKQKDEKWHLCLRCANTDTAPLSSSDAKLPSQAQSLLPTLASLTRLLLLSDLTKGGTPAALPTAACQFLILDIVVGDIGVPLPLQTMAFRLGETPEFCRSTPPPLPLPSEPPPSAALPSALRDKGVSVAPSDTDRLLAENDGVNCMRSARSPRRANDGRDGGISALACSVCSSALRMPCDRRQALSRLAADIKRGKAVNLPVQSCTHHGLT